MLKKGESAKADILNLPAPDPVLLLEGPKKLHNEASTNNPDQKGITAKELAETLREMNESMERKLKKQNDEVRARLDEQNKEVRTRLERQEETSRAQAEATSRNELLLASLVARLPSPNGE
jgi:ElaB/YqjD/DUF883 family membrane-anchored ribosome-binding protein